VALDVHRDFCEVALIEDGALRSAGRVETKPDALELFARSLDRHDYVAVEVTGNAWEIARIIEPHVARVIVVRRLLPLIGRGACACPQLGARSSMDAGLLSWQRASVRNGRPRSIASTSDST
jgi:hypothetical protein